MYVGWSGSTTPLVVVAMVMLCTTVLVVDSVRVRVHVRGTPPTDPDYWEPTDTDERGLIKSPQWRYVMVAQGENLATFARRNGFENAEIINMWNPCLTRPPYECLKHRPIRREEQKREHWVYGQLKPGIELKVPYHLKWPGGKYTTRVGDTLPSVARIFKRDPTALYEANLPTFGPKFKGGYLKANLVLKIPKVSRSTRGVWGFQNIWGNPGDPQTIKFPK